MNTSQLHSSVIGRESIMHALYEAAELEHNLMCSYLYAAFSLKTDEPDGLAADECAIVQRWKQSILQVAIEEMGHLIAVWNITSALGAAPRFGRANFPLDAGYLPASIIVKLAPFNRHTLQHFIFLERPEGSLEPEGEGFAAERQFVRGTTTVRLTPVAIDYTTVGEFYHSIKNDLIRLVEQEGETNVFRGDPGLQIAGGAFGFHQIKPVICLKTALSAIDAIVLQGEGSRIESADSHYRRFVEVRSELDAMLARNPDFRPAFPAATNPVLRRPPRPEGKVWLENPSAIAIVDLANASYGLMLRLLAYAYSLPASQKAEKSFVMDMGIGLMRAMALLGEQAARLPAGDANPNCNAGVSFTILRDTAAFPIGEAAELFFVDRLSELTEAVQKLQEMGAVRYVQAAQIISGLLQKAQQHWRKNQDTRQPAEQTSGNALMAERPGMNVEVESVVTTDIEIRFNSKRCIHARFCVTGAPNVFLANVKGPWIHPETMPVDQLVEVAHACPSGAIQYSRFDGKPNESASPVNLVSVREAGPYAFRGDLELVGNPADYRMTLCRCGGSRNKPFCDGSHHDIGFAATGEPATADTNMLAARNGPLKVEPEKDGPLHVQGNLEIISGTGRVIARVEEVRLCRCGGSHNKPFCDGTHARNGFKT